LNTPPGELTIGSTSTPDANGAFASRHPGGAQFVFGDGHVQFVSANIAFGTYEAIATRAGDEPISAADL
jgi:prepilin-type processing-associated H-X9-DG protein